MRAVGSKNRRRCLITPANPKRAKTRSFPKEYVEGARSDE
jgi:hypothetical protein